MVLNVKNVCILKVYVLLYNVRILYIFYIFFNNLFFESSGGYFR